MNEVRHLLHELSDYSWDVATLYVLASPSFPQGLIHWELGAPCGKDDRYKIWELVEGHKADPFTYSYC